MQDSTTGVPYFSNGPKGGGTARCEYHHTQLYHVASHRDFENIPTVEMMTLACLKASSRDAGLNESTTRRSRFCTQTHDKMTPLRYVLSHDHQI